MISRIRYSTSGARARAASVDKLLIPTLCAITSTVSLGTMLISVSFHWLYYRYLLQNSTQRAMGTPGSGSGSGADPGKDPNCSYIAHGNGRFSGEQ